MSFSELSLSGAQGKKLLRGLRSNARYPDYSSCVGSTVARYEIEIGLDSLVHHRHEVIAERFR